MKIYNKTLFSVHRAVAKSIIYYRYWSPVTAIEMSTLLPVINYEKEMVC